MTIKMSGLDLKDVTIYRGKAAIDWSKVTMMRTGFSRYVEEQRMLRADIRIYRCVLFDGPRHGEIMHVPVHSLRPMMEFIEDSEPVRFDWRNPLSVYHQMPRYYFYEAKRVFEDKMAILYIYRAG